jgi:hypothetical protein
VIERGIEEQKGLKNGEISVQKRGDVSANGDHKEQNLEELMEWWKCVDDKS